MVFIELTMLKSFQCLVMYILYAEYICRGGHFRYIRYCGTDQKYDFDTAGAQTALKTVPEVGTAGSY